MFGCVFGVFGCWFGFEVECCFGIEDYWLKGRVGIDVNFGGVVCFGKWECLFGICVGKFDILNVEWRYWRV